MIWTLLLACGGTEEQPVVVEPTLVGWSEMETESISSPVDTVDNAHIEPIDTGYIDITVPCRNGETGAERDCGYTYQGKIGCLIGERFMYDFGPDPTLEVQALRICTTTRSEGVPCDFADRVAQALGRDVRITCPVLEPGGNPDVVIGGNGGGISIYTAEANP